MFLATGRPQYILYVQGGTLLLLIPALLVGASYGGILGVAWALVGTGLLTIAADLALLFRLLALTSNRVLAVIWRPLMAVGIMGIAIEGIHSLWPMPDSLMGWTTALAMDVGTGVIVYPASTLALWGISGCVGGAERNLIAAAQSVLRKVGWWQSVGSGR